MKTLILEKCGYDLSVDAMKEGSIFGALSDKSIQYMLSHGELQEYQENEVVYKEGDDADCFFVVLYGSVKLSKFYPNLDKQVNVEHTNNLIIDFGCELGYATMLALQKRAMEARAQGVSLLLKMDWTTINELHENYSFDFGILILNLSREIARKLLKLGAAMSTAGIWEAAH